MKCPFCGYLEDRVVDSREARDGHSIRRRRECLHCTRRFTSYERIDEIPYMVVKKDGRREPFDRNKIMSGLMRACEKRPIPAAKLESIVNAVEKYVQESPERERPTTKVGEIIMRRLKELEQENSQLKRLLAERDLEIDAVRSLLRKNGWALPHGQRERGF